jgi:hypothetical protein
MSTPYKYEPIDRISVIYNFEQKKIKDTRSDIFNNEKAKEELVEMFKHQSKDKGGLSPATNPKVQELEQLIIKHKAEIKNLKKEELYKAFIDMLDFETLKGTKGYELESLSETMFGKFGLFKHDWIKTIERELPSNFKPSSIRGGKSKKYNKSKKQTKSKKSKKKIGGKSKQKKSKRTKSKKSKKSKRYAKK